MRTAAIALFLTLLSIAAPPASAGQDQTPKPAMMDTPGVHILKGLTVPEFEEEMQFMVVALGVNCGYCHARRDFASDANPRKETARRMLEMVKTINQQFFPDYQTAPGESRIGRVTCYTCHQGEAMPSREPGGALR
jgi:hypothetical protein